MKKRKKNQLKNQQEKNQAVCENDADKLHYEGIEDPSYVPADYNDQELHTDCHHGQS